MNPPCMRNLNRFVKKGCPQRLWDGKEGCPCWIEMAVSKRGAPLEKEVKKQCMDLWTWQFQWATLGLLEGNQSAVERFRNAMCEPDPSDPFNDNKAKPKSDLATVALLGVFERLEERQKIAMGLNATVEKD